MLTVVLFGPPVRLASAPFFQPGLQFKPSLGAKALEYVLISPPGTPLSPGTTSPVGVVPVFAQVGVGLVGDWKKETLELGKPVERSQGKIVEFWPGLNR